MSSFFFTTWKGTVSMVCAEPSRGGASGPNPPLVPRLAGRTGTFPPLRPAATGPAAKVPRPARSPQATLRPAVCPPGYDTPRTRSRPVADHAERRRATALRSDQDQLVSPPFVGRPDLAPGTSSWTGKPRAVAKTTSGCPSRVATQHLGPIDEARMRGHHHDPHRKPAGSVALRGMRPPTTNPLPTHRNIGRSVSSSE